VQPRPPYLVPLTAEQYRKIFEWRRKRDIPVSNPASNDDQPEEANDTEANDTADEEQVQDPQLQKAVEYVQQQAAQRVAES
jgi:hypothetical protein